ncbi:ferritin-like domain-containing protein [Patescibacteria group bacterium]|nr:ferritin-like domain-containing protein [Patescibacteria group bacterium]
MKYSTLDDLLLLKIKSLYDTEQELIKALPKMAKKASSEELKNAFRSHLEETKAQKERLEKVFEIMGKKAQKVKVEAIRGLVEDSKWLMEEDMSPLALDAALIGAAQYVEHYEIAGYGTAKSWAEELGYDDIAELLDETLKEEEKTDTLLTSLAEQSLNEEALLGLDKKEDVE